MKMHPFFQLLILSFIVFLALYIASLAGYTEYQRSYDTYLTEEAMQEFEEDVASGKEVDIKDYVSTNTVDYSSPISRLASKIGTELDSFMEGGLSDFMKRLLYFF